VQTQPDETAAEFYEDSAVAATAVGVAVDIYAVSPLACGLDMLGCLASSSGGSMYLYPSLEQAALPQVTSPATRNEAFPGGSFPARDRKCLPGSGLLCFAGSRGGGCT